MSDVRKARRSQRRPNVRRLSIWEAAILTAGLLLVAVGGISLAAKFDLETAREPGLDFQGP